LALDDLTRAADLFRPIHDAQTRGRLGRWRCRHCWPMTLCTIAAQKLSARAGHPNLFIKIRHKEGLPAIEEAILPVCGQRDTAVFPRAIRCRRRAYCVASNGASPPDLSPGWLRGSMFISRWMWPWRQGSEDVETTGLASHCRRIYQAYLELLNAPRSQRRIMPAPAATPAVASTGTKDPKAPTFSTQSALLAVHGEHDARGDVESLADHGEIAGHGRRRGDCEKVLAEFAKAPSTWMPWRATSGRGGEVVCEILTNCWR